MLKTLRGPGFFRLVLALIVFVSHGTRIAIGSSAVYLFFGLSGYWIYQMYLHKYSKTRSPYLTYMVSRLWRLLPVFLLINTAAILVETFYLRKSFLSGGAFARLHFIFSNIFLLGYDSLPNKPLVPAWSLDLEMQFYIVAPLLIWWVRKRPRALLFVSAILTAITFYFALPLMTLGIFFFAAGLATAASPWKPSKSIAVSSLALTLLAIVACVASPWKGVLLTGSHPGPLDVYNGLANLLLALIALPLALFTTQQKGDSHDSIYGELSYIVYLLHWIFLQCFRPPANYALRAAEEGVMVGVVLAFSYLVLRVFDKPMNERRSAWVKSRLQRSASQ